MKTRSFKTSRFRALITNLTCPGDSSLYIEWAQPEQYYHGVDMYNVFIKTRQEQEWEVKQVAVPPVAKHNVEKVGKYLKNG